MARRNRRLNIDDIIGITGDPEDAGLPPDELFLKLGELSEKQKDDDRIKIGVASNEEAESYLIRHGLYNPNTEKDPLLSAYEVEDWYN